MKVLFDHIVFQNQRVGGVSKALTEMITNLPNDVEVELAVKESDNLYLHETRVIERLHREVTNPSLTQRSFLGGVRFKGKGRLYDYLLKLKLLRGSETKNNHYCNHLLREGNYDVFQPTHYNSYFLGKNKKPFVLIVHDIVPELFPQFYANNYPDILEREKLIPIADHIVAISENTKTDIMKRWSIPEDKITVIHWGAPDISQVHFKEVVPYRYVLYVGGRDKYKQFRYFAREAKRFLDSHADMHVVCTGAAFTKEEKIFLSKEGLYDRFHTLFASTDELFSLYHFALCFVFPSLYEGFGLPTLEAMACGCPVLISDTSCFPEIGGDVALYIKKQQDGSSNISEQLQYLYNMKGGERRVLIDKCLERAKSFSWKETANKYAELYRKLASY